MTPAPAAEKIWRCNYMKLWDQRHRKDTTMPKDDNKPQITFWMYKASGVGIPADQIGALRAMLKSAGAKRVTVLSNGAVNATFASWEALEHANKTAIHPLEKLFGNKDLRSVYANPFIRGAY
jgi:hypothetical protein